MKKNLKISTLSIVCVLCTSMAMPSFGASAVRSIGGAGTYSSAASAANSGVNTSSGSTKSVRAGSLRATGAKTASTASSASSTRAAAANPRLSIGKYLGGATAVGGSGSAGTIKPGQSGWNNGMEQRVSDLELDVKQLQEDFEDLTDGGYRITVEDEDGKLTISQGDKKIWSGEFATADGLQALEDKINEIVVPDVSDLVTSAQLAELRTVLEKEIAKKQNSGDYATADALKTVSDSLGTLTGNVYTKAEIDKKIADAAAGAQIDLSGYATTSALDALTLLVNGNKDEITALKNAGYITAGALTEYAKRTELSGFVTSDQLTNLRTALETEIAKKQNSGDYATADALKAVSDSLGTLKGNVYTKAQVDQKIADAATGGQIDLSGYATTSALDALTLLVNGNTDEITALKNAGYVTETQVQQSINTAINAYEIPDNSITVNEIQEGAVTSAKINTEAAEGEMVMLMSNGDGTSEWVSVTVDAE